MTWHEAAWELDLSVSDGCHWVLSLEWDDGEYHPVDDGLICGNAESISIWEPVSDDELEAWRR